MAAGTRRCQAIEGAMLGAAGTSPRETTSRRSPAKERSLGRGGRSHEALEAARLQEVSRLIEPFRGWYEEGRAVATAGQ